MFTGLVQQVGTCERLERSAGGWRLRVRHAPWPEGRLAIGESVAVQGACLTVVDVGEGSFAADLLDETLRRTSFRRTATGSRLNLERALRLGDRLGGHIVTGHVDESGTLKEVRPAGRDRVLRIACSPGLGLGIVPKGSICIDGVSLTVTAVADAAFEVQIIPHTWSETSLSERRPGDPVNLEGDILGKHVARLLAGRSACLSLDHLSAAGFTT